MAKATEKDDKEPAATGKKSKLKLMLILGLAVTAAAGGFFGWRYFSSPATSAGAAEEGAHEGEETVDDSGHGGSSAGHGEVGGNAIINFEPFLVNLADTEAFRYLRVTIRVVVTNKQKAESIALTEVLMSKTRDAVLDILASKASTEIITTEGKELLKAEIKDRLNSFLPDKPVLEVFFTDFVVQL
jgi:flagellar FliL protein